MEGEEREARNLIAISVATRAIRHRERFPISTDSLIVHQVSKKVDEIISCTPPKDFGLIERPLLGPAAIEC